MNSGIGIGLGIGLAVGRGGSQFLTSLSWSLLSTITPEISTGSPTYVLNTVATFYDGTDWASVLANVPRFHATRGYQSSPAVTNKCTNYNAIPADTFGATLAAGNATLGLVYEIVTITAVDWDAVGILLSGVSNTIGAQYVITGVLTFTANDTGKEVILAIGTMAYHDGATFQNPIPGMTLSGDVTAVLSIVDDAAALATLGIDSTLNPADKVYCLDNSLGAVVANCRFKGLAGNTNGHTWNIIGRSAAGTHNVFISGNFGDRYDLSSASYIRGSATTSSPLGTDEGVIQTPAAGALFLTLNNLTESEFALDPALTAGAAATHNKSENSIQIDGNLPTSGLRHISLSWTPLGIGTVKQCILSSWSDATNYWAVWQDASGTTLTFEKVVAGVSEVATVTVTPVVGTTYDLDPIFNADNTMTFSVDGVGDTVNTSTVAAVVSGTTMRVGDLNGTFTSLANISLIRVTST